MIRVLINCRLPFALAHGGHQVGIDLTTAALRAAGVHVEHVRWWDDTQTGDVLHFHGRMDSDQINFAHQKGMKVVMQELLTGPGSRSPFQLRLQRFFRRVVQVVAPPHFTAAFNWQSYRSADALIALTDWEKHLMNYLFDAAPDRIFVVPNGVDAAFLNSAPVQRGKWLICTGSIAPRKRNLELAQAAVLARTPVWIVGRPYAQSDPYARQFYEFIARNPEWICTESPPMEDRQGLAKIYRQARAFVLLSAIETRCLAAEEAAACGCPLLLSDLPWAHSTFREHAQYCPIVSPERTAAHLRKFYDAAPGLSAPPKPAAWADVAKKLKEIYEGILDK